MPIPALSPTGLLILLVLVGGSGWLMRRYARPGGQLMLVLCVVASALTTVSALAFVADGSGIDWNGIAPLGQDNQGDAPAGQDLVALYAATDGAKLALRIDMVLARDAANQAPVVNAGANQAVTLPAAATLAGTATDDGQPTPAHLTTTWSLVSGPSANVVFGNSAIPATSATFSAPGLYTLRMTADDGALSTTSDMQVTVSDAAPVFLAVPDRTIALGTRYQQLLVASDANVGDTLSYALPTAPTGAALSPSPLIDWTPTAAQLGPNTFTATVADTAGHTATTTFHVTVEHTNQAPQLAPQVNVILPVGAAFSRTLQATDPDAGDTLTFALVSGPAGMTLTGGVLNWPTAGVAPGDAAVTVSVTDAGGLTDSKPFTVTLTPAAPGPVARDDQYQVQLGETLTIPAAGVLGNDTAFSGNPLSATKLTDPDKGTLNALNADGGFNYTAPATLPPVTGLNPVVEWRWGLGTNGAFVLAADFNHDQVVEHVSSDFGNFRAWRGSDGAQLWQLDRSIKTHADISGCGTAWEQFALGDVAGDGDIYLFSSINCDQLGYAGFPDRLFAVNASQVSGGKVAARWLSPRLSQPHPGAYATATSSEPANPPITPSFAASANGSVPTLARLTADGATKLITRFLARSDYGYYYDTPYSNHLAYAACRTVTGLPADEGRPCKATFVIDAATGAID
ncbi:putative Ig domain-containing protein [Candidatus Thiodictyon syntrophicum]|uniref:putative Ig domain-containing protein n=1 Tax=Candidatus Thiodictyon syntrophicum TaxID=1166950 RepID=UPI0012FD8F6A|nr:putative Ig domain-containing protein [Candidatus Thiodictyon syntrophicum]